jgi:hypothetical protein
MKARGLSSLREAGASLTHYSMGWVTTPAETNSQGQKFVDSAMLRVVEMEHDVVAPMIVRRTGATASKPDEIVVSPQFRDDADVEVGGTVVLDDHRVRIVGTAVSARDSNQAMVFAPSNSPLADALTRSDQLWLVQKPPLLTDPEVAYPRSSNLA